MKTTKLLIACIKLQNYVNMHKIYLFSFLCFAIFILSCLHKTNFIQPKKVHEKKNLSKESIKMNEEMMLMMLKPQLTNELTS